MSKRKNKPRNLIKAAIAHNDPTRFRTRTVKPEKGKGRKERPRNKNVDVKNIDIYYFAA